MGRSRRKRSQTIAPRVGHPNAAAALRTPPGPPRSRSNIPVYVLLTVAVLAVFHQVAGYEFVDLDDLTYVVDNAAVTAVFTVHGLAWAVASLVVAAPSTRITNALVSCAVYLVQMVWPSGLAALYPYPRTVPAWQAVGAAVLLAGISVAVVRERRRVPYAVVGWVWYLVTLLPVLGFIQAGPQARADRYTYVAMTGISIIATWGLAQLLGRDPRRRVALAGSACAVIAIFGALAWQQVQYWRSTESLFRRALAVTDGNYVAHRGLGAVLLERKQIDEATVELRSAVALAPLYADAHSDLGNALLAANQPEEALTHLERAVQLQPTVPGFRVNLGSGLYSLGRSPAADAATHPPGRQPR